MNQNYHGVKYLKRNARIISTGHYAPERIIPNQYFNDLFKEDVSSWLIENLTIRERRWCNEDQSTAGLCVEAGKRAIENAGIQAEDIDLIVVATDTPEYISPSSASVVQYRLGAENAGTFDLNTACAGFVTALDLGAKYIQADEDYNHILIIGVYAMSKYVNLKDKKTATLFADGAGAVILKSTTGNRGWLGSQLISKGQYHDWMGVYAGGTRFPITKEALETNNHLLQFAKKFPKEVNPIQWTRMIRHLLEKIGCEPGDVDMFFFTQININSIKETLDNLGLPMDKTHTIMDRYGYTGSACIPMALAEAEEHGKVKRNDLIFFVGSGGGLAYAAAAFRW